VNWSNVGAVSDSRALALSLGDLIRLVPDGTRASTASFQYRAWDRSSGAAGTKLDASQSGGETAFSTVSNTATLSVTGINDAPALGDAALAADAVGGASVDRLFSGLFSDVDPGASLAGIAVVGNTADPALEGSWEYSSDGGASWFAVGAVGDDASALALDVSALLRFVAKPGFAAQSPLIVRGLDDSYAGSFSFTAAGSESRVTLDASAHGGSSAIAGATAELSLRFAPLTTLVPEAYAPRSNDAPELPVAAAAWAGPAAAAPSLGGEAVVERTGRAIRLTPLEIVAEAASQRRAVAASPADSAEAAPVIRVRREASAAVAGGPAALLTPQVPAELFGALDRMRAQLADAAPSLDDPQLVLSSVAMSMGLSVGYLLWLTRGGLLMASLVSSMPAWRLIDPIPVLTRFSRDEEGDAEEQESLASMLRPGRTREPRWSLGRSPPATVALRTKPDPGEPHPGEPGGDHPG
jgi:hypothetical protein